jgi:hypothetical protein
MKALILFAILLAGPPVMGGDILSITDVGGNRIALLEADHYTIQYYSDNFVEIKLPSGECLSFKGSVQVMSNPGKPVTTISK